MGFEVSLGPCLEARVFGNGRGREDKQSVGRWEGPVGTFITESSAVGPPEGKGEAQV